MRKVILRTRPWSPSAFLAALVAIVLAATIQEMFAVFGAKLYFAAFFPAILIASLLAGGDVGGAGRLHGADRRQQGGITNGQ